MKKASLFMALVSIIMVVFISVPAAWGYFTTYTRVAGGHRLVLGHETEIDEGFSDWTKHVTIQNKEGSQPVFVRARGYCGDKLTLAYSAPEGHWRDGGDGWWYCDVPVEGGGEAPPLDVKIENIPEGAKEGEEFNVVVVYEATPVVYNAKGEAYGDWDNIQQGDEGGGA